MLLYQPRFWQLRRLLLKFYLLFTYERLISYFHNIFVPLKNDVMKRLFLINRICASSYQVSTFMKDDTPGFLCLLVNSSVYESLRRLLRPTLSVEMKINVQHNHGGNMKRERDANPKQVIRFQSYTSDLLPWWNFIPSVYQIFRKSTVFQSSARLLEVFS